MNGSLPIYRADFRDLNADAEFPVAAPKPDSLRNGMLVRMPNHLGSDRRDRMPWMRFMSPLAPASSPVSSVSSCAVATVASMESR